MLNPIQVPWLKALTLTHDDTFGTFGVHRHFYFTTLLLKGNPNG
jgi:hypothetical protein